MSDTEDKKIKRAAANVNERRRMQNINCGFEALRSLIDVQNAAKLSKSAILRHSVELLRSLMSENQQLREQNKFMRNLYCNYGSASLPPILQTPQAHRSSHKIDMKDLDETDEFSSPRKKIKFNKSDELTTESADGQQQQQQQQHNITFSIPSVEHLPPKSPRKYSPHINKLLASPKRMTRSSVIQQNLAYTSPPTNSLNPLLESPSRRSMRLIEKDQYLQTPTSTRSEIEQLTQHTLSFQSPISAKTKLTFDDPRHYLMLTPESMKMIQPRSAKRSLDAIIHAIDQIEKA